MVHASSDSCYDRRYKGQLRPIKANNRSITLPRIMNLSNTSRRGKVGLGCLLAAWLALAHAHAGTGPITQQQLMDRAAEVYAGRVAEQRATYSLDADAAFTAQLRRIAGKLIAQAARDYPETAAWPWEIHTTTDTSQNADCMAGGKIMVSKAYAERLGLNEAELAMLLAHEIGHAALRHNLIEYELALRLEPSRAERSFLELEDAVDNDRKLVAKLAPLNFAQETEADRAGLLLAWRAGWPADKLANYFRKMVRDSGAPNQESDAYPSPSSRWRAAREQAALLLQQIVVRPAD